MLKMFCICDRCKKQFEAKLAKRIIFEPALTPEETWGSKLVGMAASFFTDRPRDYCPECVSEIRNFMKSKEGESDGSSI